MKRTFALLFGMIICASVACGGAVKVTAVMAAGPKEKPTATFNTETPEVWALLKTKGAQPGDKLRGVWIADDVGDAAPPNTKIDETALTLEGDAGEASFSCTKPTKGWPAGNYHVDIYANNELTTTVKFTIEAAEKTEKKTETKSKDHADDAQYSFKVKNANVQKITKLLASEDGKKYLEFDIGRGIDVDEVVTLNWDKSTNKSECEWYIKAVYADKSVGEAVQFNFCEEDLIIEF